MAAATATTSIVADSEPLFIPAILKYQYESVDGEIMTDRHMVFYQWTGNEEFLRKAIADLHETQGQIKYNDNYSKCWLSFNFTDPESGLIPASYARSIYNTIIAVSCPSIINTNNRNSYIYYDKNTRAICSYITATFSDSLTSAEMDKAASDLEECIPYAIEGIIPREYVKFPEETTFPNKRSLITFNGIIETVCYPWIKK